MNPRLSVLFSLLILCGCAGTPQPLPSQLSLPESSSEAILDASVVTSPPKALTTVRTNIPRGLRVAGMSAKAVLRCTVLKDGRVAATEIVSATHTSFAMAAAEAVQRWTFIPAILNGERVNCQLTIPIEVSIHEDSPIYP